MDILTRTHNADFRGPSPGDAHSAEDSARLPFGAGDVQFKGFYVDIITADSKNKGKGKPDLMSPSNVNCSIHLRQLDDEDGNDYYIQKGKAIIFNHYTFHKIRSLGPRKGTEEDVKALQYLLEEMQFETEVIHDMTNVKIQEKCEEVAKEVGEKKWDALMVVVLTHGTDDGQLYAYDSYYGIHELWSHFTPDKCIELANKPKIFLIQACRGHLFDKGIDTMNAEYNDWYEGQEKNSYWSIPTCADFIFAFSSFPGYVSWRNESGGSWFMQAVCYVFHHYRHKEDLLTLLTRVNRMVAKQVTSGKNKQIPYTNFTLRMKVWLQPQEQLTSS